MKNMITISSALMMLFTVPVFASGGVPQDEPSVSVTHHRNRMIEILPAASYQKHSKNIMGEIGEGTTFISNSPYLTFIYDSAEKPAGTLRLIIESANEDREFTNRYPALRMFSRIVSDHAHPTLSALISVTHGICSDRNKEYFDAVRALESYAIKYLPNARDKKDLPAEANRTISDARNPLLVNLELRDFLGRAIGEVSLGVFVSGRGTASTCKLMLGEQVVTPKVVEKEMQKFNIGVFETANNLVLRKLENQAPAYARLLQSFQEVKDWIDQQLKQHEVKPFGTTVESYNIAPLFKITGSHSKIALHPVAMCDLSEEKGKFKQLTQIHFGQEYRDSTCLAIDPQANESRNAFQCRCDHSCFDSELGTDPKILVAKGAFHSGEADCFGDSEQAFLTFLENPAGRFIARSWIGDLETGISHVTIRLLSPRDICKFCRGTLSMSMSPERNWLQSKLKDFLTKELNLSLTINFSVRIFGYSTSPIKPERR
jgi:hypothetical protein